MPVAVRLADRAVTLVAAALLVECAVVSPLMAGISGMRTDSCGSRCDTVLVAGSGIVLIGGEVLTVAAVLLALILLKNRFQLLCWIPCLGLGAAAAVIAIADGMISVAVGP